ncbi:N4-gp56 family major capsid protein [Dokdonella soli]|uniref:N4-gp56 family major capsid protein n=1 Tax=Dokdonella soli TaxID=529810 RepID=A0ABN1ITZ0_9GAMM
MQTIVGINDPKARKLWSASLFVDQARESYWQTRFVGKGANAMTPVQLLTELERDAGDRISYDLNMQLRNKPIYGDNIQEGTEENLNFYTDQVFVDQVRGGVNAGGRMTRKRTLHDLRAIARQRMSEWWGRWGDEILFMYGSGARGANLEFIEDLNYTGFASNPFTAPDSLHQLFGGVATSNATVQATDTMSLTTIEKAQNKALTMGGGASGHPEIRPIRINGEDRYVLVMHTYQMYSLRTNTSVGQWIDVQKAAAAAQGQKNPLFTGAEGMYSGTILHQHKAAILFNNWGAGGNVTGARSLFMGRQAMVMAYGSPGSGMRFDWYEETRDNGNQIVISTNTILGCKKTTFNSLDFGVIAVDTAAADPNGGQFGAA